MTKTKTIVKAGDAHECPYYPYLDRKVKNRTSF